MSLTYINLTKILQDLVSKHDCRRTELAKYLNISPARLSNYITGKRTPDISTIVNIAEFFGIDLNTFVGVKFSGVPLYKNFDKEAFELKEKKLRYADRNDIAEIPFISIAGKKKYFDAERIPLSMFFLVDIEEPEKNAVMFEIPTDLSDDIQAGDLIVCARCTSTTLKSNDHVLLNGRAFHTYTYINSKYTPMLVDKNNPDKTIYIENEEELSSYFVLRHVFKDKRQIKHI